MSYMSTLHKITTRRTQQKPRGGLMRPPGPTLPGCTFQCLQNTHIHDPINTISRRTPRCGAALLQPQILYCSVIYCYVSYWSRRYFQCCAKSCQLNYQASPFPHSADCPVFTMNPVVLLIAKIGCNWPTCLAPGYYQQCIHEGKYKIL